MENITGCLRVFCVKCMLECGRVNDDKTIYVYIIILYHVKCVYCYTKSITPNSACNMQPAHSCIQSCCIIHVYSSPSLHSTCHAI